MFLKPRDNSSWLNEGWESHRGDSVRRGNLVEVKVQNAHEQLVETNRKPCSVPQKLEISAEFKHDTTTIRSDMHITVYVSENIWLALYILWYITSIPPPSLLLHSITSLSCCGGHVGLNPAYIYFAQGTYMKLPSLVQSVRVTLVDRREVFSFANKIRISIGTAITEKEGWVEHLAKLKETELIVTSNSSRLPLEEVDSLSGFSSTDTQLFALRTGFIFLLSATPYLITSLFYNHISKIFTLRWNIYN